MNDKPPRGRNGKNGLTRWLLHAPAGIAFLSQNRTALGQQIASDVQNASTLWYWLCAIVFAGLCGLVAFKNAKRSHLN